MGVKVRKPKGHTAWCVVIDHDGQRKSKSVGTREAAERVKREIEARLAMGGKAPFQEPEAKLPTLAVTPRHGFRILNTSVNPAPPVSTVNICGFTSCRGLARSSSTASNAIK